MTVLGYITPSQLGFCQCHEHLMLSKGKSFLLNPALCIDDVAKSLDEVKRYKMQGGTSLIDAQPCGCNRMAIDLTYISAKTNVHIIASTGFHKLVFYSDNHWIHNTEEKLLASIYINELTYGMYLDADISFPQESCPYCAGIIKTALDTEGLSPRYQRLFSAAAHAAIKTNCNIMIHIEQHANPLPLLKFLTDLGVPPHRLIFCHMDRACNDINIHLGILSSGAYLEFDTIGRFNYHSDEHEITLFQILLGAGFENQLLFSLDTTRERLKSYTPNAIGLDYILTTFIPHMKRRGITASQIEKIAVKNCIHALTQ